MKKNYFTMLFALFFTMLIYAQPPNDLCSGAAVLTVGASCSNTIDSIDNTATDSGVTTPACGFYQGRDIWYQLVVPASGALRIETSENILSSSGGSPLAMAFYNGSCGMLNEVDCSEVPGDYPLFTITETPGTTLYVRVWVPFGGTISSFNICAYELLVPANDLCSGATALTVGATCSNTLVTINGLETDSGVPDPDCSNYEGGDLWYSVIVPATGALTIEASEDDGSITRVGMAVYNGTDCNSLNQIVCNDDFGVGDFPSVTVSGTIGETYYVRVWEEGNNDLGTFNLCAFEATTTIANDACSGAIDLTVGTTCVNTLVTLTGNETSSGITDPGCANYEGNDLWYKLTMPATGGVRVETDVDDGSIDDGGMAVYTGTDCNSLTLFSCNDDGNTDSSENFERIDVAAPAGSVIYIRIWEYSGIGPGTFNICAYEITPPPIVTNDDCIDAIDLTVGITCSAIIGTNFGASSSEDTDATIPDPGCASYEGNDVWFKLTVPPSGDLEVETYEDDNSITDGGMAIYSGTCAPNGLTLIDCDDDGGNITDENFERIELLDRTPGETLYVRIWAYDNDEVGTFNICAVELNPLSIEQQVYNDFKMYPNPANNNINIKLDQATSTKIDINVYGVDGKQVLKEQVNQNENRIQLNISTLSNGIYFVKLKHDNNEIIKKFIKN